MIINLKIYIMLSKNISKTAICIFAGIIAVAIGCNRGEVASEETEEIVTPVTLTEVTIKPVNEIVELPASSYFMKKSIIKSTTTGVIEDISINLGDYVKVGQPLFLLKTREASAIEKSVSNDTSLIFKGLIKVNSSKDGVISSISHQNGDFIQEGDELAIISEQSSLVFILEAPFEFTGVVGNNKTCLILLPDNRRIKGEITGKLPAMDVQSQTVSFIVKPITNEGLPENLYARISLIKNNKLNSVVLPKTSVLGNETQTEFWVMKLINDSTAVKVPVIKGIENTEEVEIVEPVLSADDRILLTGGYGLPDTARVNIIY
jgi:biotin carboxyl carrier protein